MNADYQLVNIALCDTGEIQYTFRARMRYPVGGNAMEHTQHVRSKHPRSWQIADWFTLEEVTAPEGRK